MSANAAPPARPSLGRGVAQIALGNGIFNLGRIGVVVLLAKCTTPEFLGHFHATVAWSTPVILLLGLELRAVYISDTAREFPFHVYRRLRDLGLLVAALLLTAETVREGVVERAPWHVLLMVAALWLGRLLLAWAELYWAVFQRQERLDRLAISNALRGLAMFVPVAVSVLVLRARGSATVDQLAQAAALGLTLHVVLWWLIGWFFDRRLAAPATVEAGEPTVGGMARLFLQALPLGVVALVVNLCDNVPRLIMDRQPHGETALGYFGTLAYLPLAAQFLMVQVGTAASQRLAHYRSTDPPRFRRLFLRLTLAAGALGVAIFAICALGGHWLLRTIYTADYARYLPEFLIMVAAQCVVLFASIFGFVATQMRLFWQQVPLQLAVLAATWLAALWLIPGDPVRGGAWTMLIRSGLHTALYGACVIWNLRRGLAPAPSPRGTGPGQGSSM